MGPFRRKNPNIQADATNDIFMSKKKTQESVRKSNSPTLKCNDNYNELILSVGKKKPIVVLKCTDKALVKKEPVLVLERIDTALLKENCVKKREALGDKSYLSNICKSKLVLADSVHKKKNTGISMSKSNVESLLFKKTLRSNCVESSDTSMSSQNLIPSSKGTQKNVCDKTPKNPEPFSVSKPIHKTELRKSPRVNALSRDLSGTSSGLKGKIIENKSRTPASIKKYLHETNTDKTPLRKGRLRQSSTSLVSIIDSTSNAKATLQTQDLNQSDNSVSTESHESHSCVYSKVPRDTMINRNRPCEEKLALYEFEVDENEPVVKRKRKRNVYGKRKQKNKTDFMYHVKSKIPTKLQPTHCETRSKTLEPSNYNNVKASEESVLKSKGESNQETCSEKVLGTSLETCSVEILDAQKSTQRITKDIQICKHVHFEKDLEDVEKISSKTISSLADTGARSSSFVLAERNCDYHRDSPQLLGGVEENTVCETSKSENSKPLGSIRRRNKKANLENISPVTRPRQCRLPMRSLKVAEQFQTDVGNCVNLEVKISENQSSEILTHEKYSMNNRLLETSNVSTETVKNINTINTEERKTCSTSKPAGHSTPTKDNLLNVSVDNVRDILSPIPMVKSPNLSLLSTTNKTGSTINSSLINSVNRHIPLSRKVFFLPRQSGCGNFEGDTENVQKWDVDNCFGFEDEGNDIELSSATKTADSQSFNSTCAVVHLEQFPTRVNVKRKLDSFPEKTPCKAPRLEKETKSLAVTPRSESQNVSNIASLSNPLKQTKLDFLIASPKTPRKVDENCSPMLFKDDDMTPIHFKEPPRKSYERLHRKNLKFIGDDYVEVDEDDELHENTAASKRSKKHKLNKQEEKEAKKWMKKFNDQCEEIEDFELCVE